MADISSNSQVSDLCAITCYYNPAGYRTKAANFEVFEKALASSGVPLTTVECAFGDEPFTLDTAGQLLRVRARDVMWQKERLLNLAVQAVPESCVKVVWLDCDVIFENAEWPRLTSSLLESKAVVQPFEAVVRLPQGHVSYQGEGEEWASFASTMLTDPNAMLSGDFRRHGHTGFAWAARRDIVEKHGLYDACISGSGDHMIAHAFAGDWESRCLDRILGGNTAHRAHFARWAKSLYPDVRARIGVVPGRLLHLWHGDHANRRYVLRNQELEAFGFDPDRDIRISESGCWEWAGDRPDLKRWSEDYYRNRKEDG
jgi:hypothetical protein